MGAYCSYFYNGLYIDSTKNDIDISILKVIEDSDIKHLKYSDTPKYLIEHYDLEPVDEDGNDTFYHCIQIKKNVLLDRLEIQGYTLEFSKTMFNFFLKNEIEKFEQSDYDFMKEELKFLKKVEFEDWIKKLDFIQQNEINRFKYNGEYEDSDELLHYMLTKDWYGFQGIDVSVFLRLLLDVSADGIFLCDLTDLLLSGYIDDEYITDMKERYFKSDKIIVLTEGKSDIEILSRTLKLLYPHLYSYFAFMDFENARVAGGAGPLTAIVKSFAGVGISNKIVAIYDNDTAAIDAAKQLAKIQLPSNIKIMFLPEIERLNSYPTIGPAGKSNMNINGMTGSIEMYLGHNILFNESSNSYYPIQWTGYNSGLKQYQGEIIEKDLVQKEYRKILKICEDDSSKIENYDFKDIRLVLQNLLKIFHEFEQELIFKEFDEYL